MCIIIKLNPKTGKCMSIINYWAYNRPICSQLPGSRHFVCDVFFLQHNKNRVIEANLQYLGSIRVVCMSELLHCLLLLLVRNPS